MIDAAITSVDANDPSYSFALPWLFLSLLLLARNRPFHLAHESPQTGASGRFR
jgi:hypothetical protein